MNVLMLLAVPICSWLWAFAGAENTSKLWRRIGVGLVISLLALAISTLQGNFSYGIITLLVFPLMWIATSLGYGLPDKNDEGSPIGKFFFSLLKKPNETRFKYSKETEKKVLLAIRTFVGITYALALLPLSAIGSWILGGIVVVANTVLWSVYIKDEGMIGIYLIEELMIGAGVGFAAYLAIL